MRALIQRVGSASVSVGQVMKASIGRGLLVLLGVESVDTLEDVEWLAGKVARLRVFEDNDGMMNCALTEVQGEALVISQFTLFASTRKGNRPSFTRAAAPAHAIPLYEAFVAVLERELGKGVGTGVFGADMEVALVNDGPVTIWMDSRQRE